MTSTLPEIKRLIQELRYMAHMRLGKNEKDANEWKAADLIERLRSAPAVGGEVRAALQEAILQIEYLHEKFQPTSTGVAVIARLNRALSLAGEGK